MKQKKFNKLYSMDDGFAETFQDENKTGRTLLQSGAGLLQTRRPDKSEDLSDLGGRLVRLLLTGFDELYRNLWRLHPRLGSAQRFPASAYAAL